MNQSLADQIATTALNGGNAGFIEELYELFLKDPAAVDPAWREYFTQLAGNSAEVAPIPGRERLLTEFGRPAAAQTAPAQTAAVGPADLNETAAKQGAVSRLIQVYANRGHLIAASRPAGPAGTRPTVCARAWSISACPTRTWRPSSTPAAATTRCRSAGEAAATSSRRSSSSTADTIGAEFAHVSDTEERLWLQDNFQLGAHDPARFSARRRKTSSGS